MTKGGKSLKLNNEGASLIAVLVAIIFVTTIGAIITTITVTNIRLRQVEEAGKRNFYSAEEIMDEISAGLNNRAAEAMQKAYTDVLTDYRSLMVSGSGLQEKFQYSYMNNLTGIFWDSDDDTRKDRKISTEDGDASKFVYVYGYYDQDSIRDVMSDDTKGYFVSGDAEAVFSTDYVEGVFTLHDIRVDYVDDDGYETVITTDMVFHTPNLNFDSGNRVKDFMKYALVADHCIRVAGSNARIEGSVYAGYGGITVDNCDNVMFTGTNIVTRGNINVSSGSDNAYFGGSGSNIWAENITTTTNSPTGLGSPSSVTLDGNIYVADDLSLDGMDSRVTLRGSYYGYNFLKQYDRSDNTAEARYSSAIAINGKGSSLDMSGLKYLHLAGRTYLSRGNSINDVVLGESLSVRTNQLAYYVPERFLSLHTSGSVVTGADFTVDGLTQYCSYVNMDNVTDYLKDGEPVAAYRYRDAATGDYAYRFYLNFKSEQAANDFFAAYSAANAGKVNAFGADYADAIVLGDDWLYTLKGDLMYREDSSSSYQVENVVIDPNLWSPDVDGIYYTYADQLAKNYMSLEKYLEDWRYHTDTVTSSTVRFNDKSDEPLTGYILKTDEIAAASPVEIKTSGEVPDGAGKTLIAVCDGDYVIPEDCTDGIVIATGDVTVRKDFNGMIISQKDIILSTVNVKITSDELLV